MTAYMPVSRFLERKARLTLERVDFAIAKWTSDDGNCGVCVGGGGAQVVVVVAECERTNCSHPDLSGVSKVNWFTCTLCL